MILIFSAALIYFLTVGETNQEPTPSTLPNQVEMTPSTLPDQIELQDEESGFQTLTLPLTLTLTLTTLTQP